eukprot:6812812-Karenia_brevis.AAC.2
MAFPEQVKKLTRQFDPKGLRPYEIIKGMAKHGACPLPLEDRNWARDLQSFNTRDYFVLPFF